MANTEQTEVSSWLPVIGKSLAYLCLSKAMEREPDKYGEVLEKVKFLEGLGLSTKDAVVTAGSTSGSVRVLRHKRKKATKNGKAKKKAGTAR
jgi:hypothetical protein